MMVDYKRFRLHKGRFTQDQVNIVKLFANPDDPAANLPIFHISECGKDWYECQKDFQMNTLKFCYDDTGLVQQAGYDITAIVPHNGWSVAELSTRLTPEEVFKKYRFDGKQLVKVIVPNEDLNDPVRQSLFLSADARINVLKNKIEDGDFEERHVEELDSLRKYRTALRKVDISVSPDKVKWPSL